MNSAWCGYMEFWKSFLFKAPYKLGSSWGSKTMIQTPKPHKRSLFTTRPWNILLGPKSVFWKKNVQTVQFGSSNNVSRMTKWTIELNKQTINKLLDTSSTLLKVYLALSNWRCIIWIANTCVMLRIKRSFLFIPSSRLLLLLLLLLFIYQCA